MSKQSRILILVAAMIGVVGLVLMRLARFPPDTEPAGAYVRITSAIASDDFKSSFAYLEEEAQHAAFSIHDYATRSLHRVQDAYPTEAKNKAVSIYKPLATADGGAGVWSKLAKERGWLDRLRRDLSGVETIEVNGDRATITTARGTRYSFRRRPNGIWGLTLFTAELQAEAQRLSRDWDKIDKAAADYDRERQPAP